MSEVQTSYISHAWLYTERNFEDELVKFLVDNFSELFKGELLRKAS